MRQHRVGGSSGFARPWLRLALVGLGAALVLSACGAGSESPSRRAVGSTTTTTVAPTTTTTEPPLPVTPIAWTPCNGSLQCGTLTVPLNYADPQGATIGMAVERHLADIPADRIGSFVVNPGGPGVSGIDDFVNELDALTPQLLDDFDIVTFDPRGVERSDAVTCGQAAGATPGPVPDPVPSNAAEQALVVGSMRQFADSCEKADGSILPFVGTVDVAQDLDRLRQALGDAGLTFMGQSYGTLLGATYAQMFPTHIRAMVLDSVIDPALSLTQMTMAQAQGFEQVLNSFFSWCASTGCPWHPGSDPTTALLSLLTQSQTSPVPTAGGRTAGAGELYNALLGGMYAQSDWPTLANALAEDAAGNGRGVVAMSDHYAMDGSTNGADVAEAVDCLDHPTSRNLSSYPKLAEQYQAVAPVFGPLLAWGQAACAVWAVAPTRQPAPVLAPGSPAILVIGTTQDPATPYAWAEDVAGQLSHGALLTVDGSDHVSYFYSACVRADVQTYLVSLQVPPTGATCSD
jgi:pimeloyl-ACP methyl ester carboxylesterase